MKYSPELKGKTFERWTVIGPADSEDSFYNNFRVKCKCSCGTIRDVLWRSLINGNSKSCGCLNLEMSKKKLQQVLPIHSHYGKWEIVGESYKKNGKTFYPCRCECGTERGVERSSLVNGNSMSCGCLQSKGEFLINKWLQNNNYSFKTQYSFDDCLSPKNRKLKFDFAVFDGDIVIIEFQGSQHTKLNPKQGRFIQSEEKFNTTKLYDKIKKNYLLNNNISHLYINYTELRNIDEILQNFFTKKNKN